MDSEVSVPPSAYSHPIEAVVTERIVNTYCGHQVEGAWTEAHGILYSIGELQFESLGHAIAFAKDHPPGASAPVVESSTTPPVANAGSDSTAAAVESTEPETALP